MQDFIDIKPNSVKNILLRLPNWLGDSVMVSPTFEWLKKSFKEASFTLVGTKASCGIYQRDTRVKHIFIDKSKSSFCRIYAIKHLAKNIGSHDIAISFSNSFFSALLLYWSKSKIRMGYAKNARSFLLSHALPLEKYSPKGELKHQVALYLSLIAPLQAVQQTLQIHQSIDSNYDILPYLMRQPLTLIASRIRLQSRKYSIGINPGAAFGSAKCWEKAYFITIMEYFLTQSYNVYLFGTTDKTHTHKQIAESLIKHPHANLFYDLTDKTNLTELIDYINAMDVFITNDSGPMHIAAALNVPLIAIFGPTDMNETAPYTPINQNETSEKPPFILLSKNLVCAPCKKRKCPLKHHHCMTLITPQEVIAHANKLLHNNDQRFENAN